jgi:hypothetical protein
MPELCLQARQQFFSQGFVDMSELMFRENAREVAALRGVKVSRFPLHVRKQPDKNSIFERPARVSASKPLQDVQAIPPWKGHRRWQVRVCEFPFESLNDTLRDAELLST